MSELKFLISISMLNFHPALEGEWRPNGQDGELPPASIHVESSVEYLAEGRLSDFSLDNEDVSWLQKSENNK